MCNMSTNIPPGGIARQGGGGYDVNWEDDMTVSNTAMCGFAARSPT